nr:TonB-dependent receptor [uncultured Prevotella sp.]
MKIKKYLFLTLFFLTGAGSLMSAQAASFKMNNVTVAQAMSAFYRQTGYSFVYNTNDVKSNSRVNVNASNLKEALNQILKNSNVDYEIQGKSVILRKATYSSSSSRKVAYFQKISQSTDQEVTGKVLDEKGDPIVGATVRVKGSSEGAITDLDGNFSIDAPAGSTLEISYIGYVSKEIKSRRANKSRIFMQEDRRQLNEIVVVGYGTQKKVTVTGAIASTEGSDIAAVPTTNITNALAGRLPGLISYNRSGEPGYDDAGLLIRGASTIGDSSPLLVVDGVADRAGSLGRIDPNDIASITILKDASAAIYGSRAANGVILVTTKRGSAGRIKVKYNGDIGFTSPTILPKMCSSAEYAQLLNEINPDTYSNDDIQKFKDGSDPLGHPNIDAFKQMLRTGVQTRHNISVNGGNDNINFYSSLGYQYQNNYYKHSASNYQQYNFRTNIDFKLSKTIKVGLDFSIRQEDRNSPITGSEDIWRYLIKYNPMVNIWYPGTNYATVSSKQDNFSPATGMDRTMGYQKDEQTYTSGDLTFHWDMPWVTPGLSFDAGLYFDRSNVFYKNFQKKFYLYTYDDGAYNPVEQGQNVLNEDMSQLTGITANARINYQHTFNTVHNVSAFIAWEQYKSRYDYLQGRRQDFVSTSIDELFAGDANSATNDGTASETARMNYFGRVDYNYASKYLFQFNWRYDGSENFPRGKRFGFFPGISVGWRISEENFWKDHVKWMDYLKLRASWGQMGNDKIDDFQYITAYTFSNPGIFGSNGGQINTGLWLHRTANPEITWEVANTYNVGLDARFLNYFNFEGDFFVTKRNNILTTRNAAIPEYAGLSLPDENIGKCQNIGTELSLGYTRQINNNWGVNASVNFSYSHGTIKFIDEPSETLEWQKRTGKCIGTEGSMYLMYKADGIFHTQEEIDKYPHLSYTRVGDIKFVDVNNDGKIDGDDKVRMNKPAIPEIMYGINLGASYKSLHLSILWQGAAKVWQYTFMEAGVIGNFTKDFYDHRWTEDNPYSKYPRTYNRDYTATGGGDNRNSFWLNNASYLRLKSIDFTWDLPKVWLKGTPMTAVGLTFSGYNLLTFTGIHNIDPETHENSQGWAAWNTPQSKIYSFGVNITF